MPLQTSSITLERDSTTLKLMLEDAIDAVTQGPGLSGALITGTSFSKGLAAGLNIPILGINHLEAHIFANFLAEPDLEFEGLLKKIATKFSIDPQYPEFQLSIFNLEFYNFLNALLIIYLATPKLY